MLVNPVPTPWYCKILILAMNIFCKMTWAFWEELFCKMLVYMGEDFEDGLLNP